VLIAMLAGFAVTTTIRSWTDSAALALPKTPIAWLDAVSTGMARDSGDALLAAALAGVPSAMERDAHESCTACYARAQVLSIRLLRVLRTVATPALEIRYWPRGGYSTFVLNQQADGWQAVAIVPGPLPIA
jgi:hypothetical protein